MPNHRVIRIRLDPVVANRLSISTLLIGSVLFYQLARHQPNYAPFQAIHILWFVLGVPGLVILHEAVHALTWIVLAKLPLSSFTFGMLPQGIMPFCHCKEPLNARIYQWGALMPLFLTVPFFIALLFVWPSLWMAPLTALSLSGCWGDILLVRDLRAMKHQGLVLDCPDEAGCDVLIPLET